MFTRPRCIYRLFVYNLTRGGRVVLNDYSNLVNRQGARGLNQDISKVKSGANVLLERKFSWPNIEGRRFLFSHEDLGYDGFNRQKAVFVEQVGSARDNFFERIGSYLKESEENPVFSEDLKAATHLAETEKEIEILAEMTKRYYKTNISLKVSTFVFGPVILRLLHIQNKPDVAISLFKDKTLGTLFQQMSSYRIYMDLMYENKRYLEVIEAMDELIQNSESGMKYSVDCVTIASAACYKLNTPEHLEKVLFYIKMSEENGSNLTMRTIIYGAITAYNQKKYKLALEILDKATALQKSSLPVSYLNVKILVLTELNRFSDAVETMQSLVQDDVPHARSRDIFEEVLDNLVNKLTHHDNKILLTRIKGIKKDLKDRGRLLNHPLSEYLESSIYSNKGVQTGYKQRRNASIKKSLQQSKKKEATGN